MPVRLGFENPVDLVAPRLMKLVSAELAGIEWKGLVDFDQFKIGAGRHSASITFDEIRRCFDRDDYVTLDRKVISAARYLRVLTLGNCAKVRAFKKKRTSIMTRRRYGC
jgi:hypothetical protein